MLIICCPAWVSAEEPDVVLEHKPKRDYLDLVSYWPKIEVKEADIAIVIPFRATFPYAMNFVLILITALLVPY
jgi:hypothetical protein